MCLEVIPNRQEEESVYYVRTKTGWKFLQWNVCTFKNANSLKVKHPHEGV